MNPLKKKLLLSQFPELSSLLADDKDGVLKDLISKINMLKGDKGDKPTDEELLALIRPLIPVVKDGHTPTDKELLALIKPLIPEVKDGKDGRDGRDGKDGTDGKDGSPDSPTQIVEKLNTLKEVVDVSVIKGAVAKKDFDNQDKKVLDGMARIDGRIKLIDQRWGGHGGGGVSRVFTDDTLTGIGTQASPLHVVTASGSVIGGGGTTPQFAYWTGPTTIGSTSSLNFDIPTGPYGAGVRFDPTGHNYALRTVAFDPLGVGGDGQSVSFIDFNDFGAERLMIDPVGNVIIGNPDNPNVPPPRLVIYDDSGLIQVNFESNGSNPSWITTTLLIGSTTPDLSGAKLQVDDNIHATGTLLADVGATLGLASGADGTLTIYDGGGALNTVLTGDTTVSYINANGTANGQILVVNASADLNTGEDFQVSGRGLIKGASPDTLRILGTEPSSSPNMWQGRIIAGGLNVAFLMGEYLDQAWLGAHNAALDAWSDFYINPDGGAVLYLGGAGGPGTPIVTIDNGNNKLILGWDVSTQVDLVGSGFNVSAPVGIGQSASATSPLAITGLPTSAAGLATGDIWVDTTGGFNILKIV